MTNGELLRFLNGLGTDLDQLNASHKRLYDSAQQLMGMLQDFRRRIGSGNRDQVLAAIKQMQETQMSFNLQYLQLQSQMQNENRSYTAVSNIMKTKHDTVKNSINNVR
jgi:hypothetical protein